MTMINEAASWVEMICIEDKTSYKTSRFFDQEWLCRCPRSEITIHDNGTEFTQEFQDSVQSCGLKIQPMKVENPRPNLVERMHRTLGDVIRTENFEVV